MNKRILTYIFCTLLVSMFNVEPIVAQSDYSTAIGIRGGARGGLTIKGMGKGPGAIEGIIGFYPYSLNATVLWERYGNAFNIEDLSWYYGGGAHAAFYDAFDHDRYPRWYGDDSYVRNTVGIGVDGILGLEYKIPTIPVAISADLIPFLEVNTNGGIYPGLDPGLGIKVTL